MANVRLMQNRGDEAAELLKRHNREGIYNDEIGMTLSLLCDGNDQGNGADPPG